jgi:PAS domain S-box-containing protein
MQPKHFSIRLWTSFGFLILILLGVGFLGLNRMARTNADLQKLLKNQWTKVQESRQALHYSSLNNRVTMKIFLLTDQQEIDGLLQQRRGNSDRISQIISQLQSQIDAPREAEVLDEVRRAREPYVNSYMKALDLLLKQGKPDQARSVMAGETLAKLTVYHQAWEAFVDYQGQQMDKAGDEAQAHFQVAKELLISLLALAVLVSILTAASVIRRTMREIISRQRAEQELALQAKELVDIAARRRAEEERDRFFSLSLDLLCIAGMDGHFKRLNLAWERTFGRPIQELLSHPWLDFVHPDDHATTLAEAQKLGEGAVTLHFENRYRCQDGSYKWLAWTCVPAVAEGLIYAIARDMTEQKLAESRLREKTKLLETAIAAERTSHEALKEAQGRLVQSEKLAALGHLVAGVAHEINNPLSFTINELGDLLASCREGLVRIQQIVRDLRDFSRQESVGDVEESANLNSGIEATLNIARGQAAKHGIEIERDLAPSLQPVHCRPAKINQVILNLVLNAIDACGEKGRITVRSRNVTDGVEIQVIDDGTGIDPAIRGKIFDPFFTTKSQGKGTGLGLSISHGIIVEHGGQIRVESEPGRGSAFTVFLPLSPLDRRVQRVEGP